MLEYENDKNPDQMKKMSIKEFQDEYSSRHVPIDRREELQRKIEEIMGYNIQYKDATHVACAIYAECDYLLTTDIKFQRRYKGNEIRIINPAEFVQQMEDKEDKT